MLRFCPLPYSLSNAFIATIPSVNWQMFALATFLSTPKLFVHVFIGTKLGEIAEHGGEMDAKTKALSYLSIVLGMCVAAVTTTLIYNSTKKRAREIATTRGTSSPTGLDSPIIGLLDSVDELPPHAEPGPGRRSSSHNSRGTV